MGTLGRSREDYQITGSHHGCSSELTSSCRDSRTLAWPEELIMTSVLLWLLVLWAVIWSDVTTLFWSQGCGSVLQ